jgi:hypothetical protein
MGVTVTLLGGTVTVIGGRAHQIRGDRTVWCRISHFPDAREREQQHLLSA